MIDGILVEFASDVIEHGWFGHIDDRLRTYLDVFVPLSGKRRMKQPGLVQGYGKYM